MHDAGVIDAATHALPVQFEVANPGGQLLVGQTGTAILYQRTLERVPAVPKAAVLMEAGRPYVFVQVGGERFARRYVEIAARDGDWIGVKSRAQARRSRRHARRLRSAARLGGERAAGEGHVH